MRRRRICLRDRTRRGPGPRGNTLIALEDTYDLWYDATSVGADMVVECWISHGPRADDDTFDPQPGDWLTVGDDEEPPLPGRVIRRDGNRVWSQINLDASRHAVA